jgi:hypothetical protein
MHANLGGLIYRLGAFVVRRAGLEENGTNELIASFLIFVAASLGVWLYFG